jgi:hypothetical protein
MAGAQAYQLHGLFLKNAMNFDFVRFSSGQTAAKDDNY